MEIIKSNLKLDKSTQTDYVTQNRSVGTSDDCTTLETELWELLPDVCQFLAEVDAIHRTRLVQHMVLLCFFVISLLSFHCFHKWLSWHG